VLCISAPNRSEVTGNGENVVTSILCVTVLDIIHRPVLYLKHDVSETGLCLHLKVNLARRQRLALFGPSKLVQREDGNRIQSTKRFVFNKRTMDSVQNCDSYMNTQFSQTYKQTAAAGEASADFCGQRFRVVSATGPYGC
jgi:hypothetical protein